MYITKKQYEVICKKYPTLILSEGDAVDALMFVQDLLEAEADAIQAVEPEATASIDRLNQAAYEVFEVQQGIENEEFMEQEGNPWLIISDTVIVRHSYSVEECAEESWKASCFDVLEFDDEIGCDEYPGKVYVALYQVDVNDPQLEAAKKDVLVACGLEDMTERMDEISPELWAKELVAHDRGYFDPIGYAPEGDNYMDKYMITDERLNEVLIKLGAPEELIERGDVSRLVDNAAHRCGETETKGVNVLDYVKE